jgi:hypothetical protein
MKLNINKPSGYFTTGLWLSDGSTVLIAPTLMFSVLFAFAVLEHGLFLTTHAPWVFRVDRMNVAMTRARRHLAVVGDANVLSRNVLWKQIIERATWLPGARHDMKQYKVQFTLDQSPNSLEILSASTRPSSFLLFFIFAFHTDCCLSLLMCGVCVCCADGVAGVESEPLHLSTCS